MTRNKLLILILLGFSIRLYLASLPGFKIDVNDWFGWSDRLIKGGFSNFYSNNYFSDYTPGYLYILGLLGLIKNLFHINDTGFYLLLKIPAIISDLILSLLVYKELSKNSHSFYPLLGFVFILFNPAFIFNSSVWGQIDSVLSLFILFSIYLLKNRYLILASIFLGISLLIKPQALAIFPIFILFIIKNFKLKNILKLTLPFIITVFLLSFPFFLSNPIINLIKLIASTASQYAYTSLFAYNFWGIIGFWLPDSNYQIWGLTLFIIYWITVSYFFFRKNLPLYTLSTLALLGFYFLPTRVHERYLYPSLIFLIISAFLSKSRLLLWLSILINFIHFLNLYYVYVYYNEIYFKLPKVLYNNTLYNFLDINGKLLSVLSTIIFLSITWILIKHEYKS